MLKNYVKLEMNLKKSHLFLTLVLCLTSPIVGAEEVKADKNIAEKASKSLLKIKEHINNAADKIEAQRRVELEKVAELETIIASGKKLTFEQTEIIQTMLLTNKMTKKALNKVLKNNKEIQADFDKYVFKTRAQKLLPFLYMAYAINAAEGGEDKVLYALAGYGTGALIENTGFGISAGVTWAWHYEF